MHLAKIYLIALKSAMLGIKSQEKITPNNIIQVKEEKHGSN